MFNGRIGEIAVFAQVVEAGGFSAAARSLGMSPSGVSKLIARLEDRLGARLLNRSTRNMQLTTEGATFHDRVIKILAEVADAEREISALSAPRGTVRATVNVPFGLHCLHPAIPTFTQRYPAVTLDLKLTDRVVDLMDDRADVAIRTGTLPASDLMARKLGSSPKRVVASPDYLSSHGHPRRPADLAEHNCIRFSFPRRAAGWPMREKGLLQRVPLQGNLRVADGESVRQLALAGAGLARLADFHIADDIAAGRLLPVLEAYNPGDEEPVNALFLGHGGHIPRRVRVFVDFLAEEINFAAMVGKAKG